jgi:hypothetical protein
MPDLRIKAFYGTFENAVKTQIQIAIPVNVLAAIIRKQLRLPISRYTFLKILSISLFENMPILRAFAQLQDPSIERRTEGCNYKNLLE